VIPALAILTMTVPVAWERQLPVVAAMVVAAGTLLNEFVIGPMIRCGPCLPAVFVIAFFAGTRLTGRRLVVATALCAAGVTLQSFYDPQLGASFLFAELPAVAAACLAGQLARSRSLAAAALRERNAMLREQREQTAQLAVAADRARVAADLDGFLRERIAVIAEVAASGRQLIMVDQAAASEAFAAVESSGRATLAHMREVVGSLREEGLTGPQPVLAQLGGLLESATTADARLRVEGSPRALPAGVELSAYRIVEHLLTVLQDTPEVRVEVLVRFGPDALELDVAGPTRARRSPWRGSGWRCWVGRCASKPVPGATPRWSGCRWPRPMRIPDRLVRLARDWHGDAVLAGALIAFVLVLVIVQDQLNSVNNVLEVACGCGVIGCVAIRRIHPSLAAVTAAALLAASDLGSSSNLPDALILVPVFVLAYSLGSTTGRSAPALLVLIAGLQVANGPAVFNPIVPVLTIGPWAIGLYVRSRRNLAEQLAARSRELEAERALFAAEAIRYERARIARELHDIVAHCVSVMVIQASAGRRIAAADPVSAGEAFEAIEETARQAEAEIGRLVDLLDQGKHQRSSDAIRLIGELVVPMGARLAAQRPGVREIRISYGAGDFYNGGPRHFARRADPAARTRLYQHDGELVLDLPLATEAVVPHQPHPPTPTGSRSPARP
jgi:signal transduction histidine kinase